MPYSSRTCSSRHTLAFLETLSVLAAAAIKLIQPPVAYHYGLELAANNILKQASRTVSR